MEGGTGTGGGIKISNIELSRIESDIIELNAFEKMGINSLIAQTRPPVEPHPTDAESIIRVDPETKVLSIEVGGGPMNPGGYSIGIDSQGENPVKYYRD